MANYYSITKTSSFRVTDENRFRELVKNLISWGPDDDEVFVAEYLDGGDLYFGISCDGDLEYKINEESWDIGVFHKELQKILHPDDVYIEWSQGNEKCRYMESMAMVITKDKMEYLQFSDIIGMKVREITGNQDFKLNDVM